MPHPMTDEEWEAQNGSLPPAQATARGLCWKCSGKRRLFSAFGGDQFSVPCSECDGTGKAKP
ncbi:hypothetical protein ACF061_00835 [Streptomyces sp. NPDC015220]|uniref:hypothetical protein n=1 Tax=Streptomyces sp. NPDC015220 TaxID=3364947 RepID=UPI0036FDB48F